MTREQQDELLKQSRRVCESALIGPLKTHAEELKKLMAIIVRIETDHPKANTRLTNAGTEATE